MRVVAGASASNLCFCIVSFSFAGGAWGGIRVSRNVGSANFDKRKHGVVR